MKFEVLVPIAAITNYLKPSGLNNVSLLSYNSVVHKLKMGLTGLKSGCEQGHISFWSV